MKKFKKIILCTCLSIALLSTYGCSSSQDSSNTSTEASMTDATKSDVTDNTSEKVVEDTEKVSEEVVSEDTTENASEDTTTETVAKGDDKKTEATTEGKTESKKENKTENTQQQNTTQATQNTTQESSQKPSNNQKPSNSASQNSSSQTTQQNTEHQHVWVDHKKTVHHDAQYEDQEVTKYKQEYHLYCNTCGADITNIGSTAHDEASGTMRVNGGTDENPWWIETTRCSGSHGSWIPTSYTEVEKVKVKDAYDEEVTDYQYCSVCGQRKDKEL